MKAALRCKDLITASTEDTVERKVSEKALSRTISALGYNLLRSVHECETAKKTWNKLQQRYAGKTLIYKLELLNNMLNTRFKQATNMGDHVAKLESQFS